MTTTAIGDITKITDMGLNLKYLLNKLCYFFVYIGVLMNLSFLFVPEFQLLL